MTQHAIMTAQGLPKQTAEAQRIIAAHLCAVQAMEGLQAEERRAYEISAELIAAYYIAARQNRHVALTTLDHIMQLSGHEMPDAVPFWGSMTDDAEHWADFASDTAVATMLSACLKRLQRNPLALPNPKKKALVAVWNSLPPAEKRAFLAHVAKDAEA